MAGTTDVAEVLFRMRADMGDLDRELKRAETRIRTSSDNMAVAFNTFDAKIGAVHNRLLSFRNLAIVGAVAGLGALVVRSLNAAGALQDAADAAGLNVERYQELQKASQLSGVSADAFASAMGRLAKLTGDAAAGGKEALDQFNALGVGILDTNGNLRSQDDILGDVIDKIGGYGTQAERASAAAGLFGREAGPKFAAFIGQGEEAINGLISRARDLGLILDEEVVRNADEASDNLETLSEVISVKLTDALARAAPAINALVDALVWLLTPFEGETKVEALSRQITDLDTNIAELQSRSAKGGTVDLFGLSLNEQQQQEALDFWASERDATEIALSDEAEMAGRGISRPRSRGSRNPPARRTGGGGSGLSQLERARQKIGDVNALLQETIDKSTQALLERPMAALAEAETRKHAALTAFIQAQDEMAAERAEQIKRVLGEVAADNQRRTEQIEAAWSGAFRSIGQTMIDTLTDSSLTAADKMKRILFSALEQIANAAITQLGGDSPFSILGKQAGGFLGNIFGSIFGGGTTFGTGTLVGGGGLPLATLAEGGPLKAGQMALVGEKGPELVVPSANSHVMTNAETRGLMAGGGPTVVVNQTWNVGTGASEAAQVVRAMLPQIEARTLAGVSNSLARNGTLRKQVG